MKLVFTPYKMRQNPISLEDEFWLENAAGKRIFKMDDQVLRIGKTLAFNELVSLLRDLHFAVYG